MDKLMEVKMSEIQAHLALVVDRLGEAAATLAGSAVPMLGVPPATAPPTSVPLAQLLSAHAAPVALSAPQVSRTIPVIASAARP